LAGGWHGLLLTSRAKLGSIDLNLLHCSVVFVRPSLLVFRFVVFVSLVMWMYLGGPNVYLVLLYVMAVTSKLPCHCCYGVVWFMAVV
jgi:hypothetical protein